MTTTQPTTHCPNENLFYTLTTTLSLSLSLSGVTCDIDHTRIKLHFTSEVYSAEWLVKFHDLTDHYLIGGLKWDCPMVDATRGGLIIRRVIGAGLSGNYITVTAAEAMYDEIYESADISFNTAGACSEDDANALGKEVDKDVCVGWNSDCTSGAKATIPLFSNKATTLACDDCFVDFHVDVFIDVSIRGFEVQNLSAGFRNMYANGSLALGAIAKANWNTGVDKTINLVPQTNLINFKVGPVPFLIYFDMPVQITTDVSFNTDADAKFGAALNLQLGDAYVNWTPDKHWSHTKPTPQMSFTPTLTPDCPGSGPVTPGGPPIAASTMSGSMSTRPSAAFTTMRCHTAGMYAWGTRIATPLWPNLMMISTLKR